MFPSAQFATDDWLAILRELGLQGSLDADLFLLCARRVHRSYSQSKAAGDKAAAEEALASASALVKHLIACFGQLQSPAFCEAVAGIAFVPADTPISLDPPDAATPQWGAAGQGEVKGLGAYGDGGGGGGGGVELVRFADAAMPADKYLVWTVMPVLRGVGGSAGGVGPNEMMRMQLNMASPPPLALVLRHLANIRPDALHRWPLPDLALEACYQKTYEFLWSRWADMGGDDRQRLRNMACVPVHDTLVKPSRIFCRLTGDFSV